MFCLPNLTALNVTRLNPWEFKGVVPPNVRENKIARSHWITQNTTSWNVYSLVEGYNANARVLTPNDSREGNPPRRLYGFVADCDAPIADDELLRYLEKFPYQPAWLERTLSGNVRLLWFFETPIWVPSAKWMEHFLVEVLEHFPIRDTLPGFDRKAWCSCTRYFTNSTEWKEFAGAQPIPTERVLGWCVKISARFDWRKESGGVSIPLNVLIPALKEKYPRFADWPGEFELDSSGPSFWVDGSTSPTSAVVRATGMQTFANHAIKGFYHWSELLGPAFVKNYQVDSIGEAVKDIWHDGRHYWKQLPDGHWKAFDRTDIVTLLRVGNGLSLKVNKDGNSDVTVALDYILKHQNIFGAAPFIFRPSGLITFENRRFLNISDRRVLAPAPGPAVFGPSGPFPWLSHFLSVLFRPAEQLDYWMSWFHHWYKFAYELDPRPGHAIFLAGPQSVGKTFLSHSICGGIMGGSAEAEAFLLGRDSFTSDLFTAAHWYVDDAVFTADPRNLRQFSESIKKLTANRKFRSNQKFRVATVVEWMGRIIITCNCDEESIRAIPDLSGSILDKISLFRTADITVKFPEEAEKRAILDRELPYLARYALDYEIPAHCRTEDTRFGVKAYHEESLKRTAELSSNTAAFKEILEDWKKIYAEETKAAFWEGTAYQLFRELNAVGHNFALRRFDVATVARQLVALKNKGDDSLECDDAEGQSRKWRIVFEKPTTGGFIRRKGRSQIVNN